MFDKILLAVDGSPSSNAAVDTALGLAAKMGAQVEIVHVREHDVIPSKAGSGPDLEMPAEAAAMLAATLDKFEDGGVNAHTTLLQAQRQDVAREIMAVADAVGADFIVVGNRGLTAFEEAVLGSVSHNLVKHAGRPVLIARELAAVPAGH